MHYANNITLLIKINLIKKKRYKPSLTTLNCQKPVLDWHELPFYLLINKIAYLLLNYFIHHQSHVSKHNMSEIALFDFIPCSPTALKKRNEIICIFFQCSGNFPMLQDINNQP